MAPAEKQRNQNWTLGSWTPELAPSSATFCVGLVSFCPLLRLPPSLTPWLPDLLISFTTCLVTLTSKTWELSCHCSCAFAFAASSAKSASSCLLVWQSFASRSSSQSPLWRSPTLLLLLPCKWAKDGHCVLAPRFLYLHCRLKPTS